MFVNHTNKSKYIHGEMKGILKLRIGCWHCIQNLLWSHLLC